MGVKVGTTVDEVLEVELDAVASFVAVEGLFEAN
jgi:hypothetical protein